MTPEADLAIIRRAYARQILHGAGVDDPRLERAFAEVPREDFLGPGPWAVMRLDEGFRETPDADPAFVYQDLPVSLVRDKRLNNGQPSFLARLIGACAIGDGDDVAHVGTGTGYYTGVMSRLAGAGGHVLGVEVEPELARRAVANLEGFANARIVVGDGFTLALPPSDAILVNAGTPRLAASWLDALKPGGRLVVPLALRVEDEGQPMTRGAIFKIIREGDGRDYSAQRLSGTVIYPCRGASDPSSEAALAAAFASGRGGEVRRLRREPVADSRTYLRGDGWSLTFD